MPSPSAEIRSERERTNKKKSQIQAFKNTTIPESRWMELENIILSEVSQAQKTKNRMFSLICRL
jgi:hypothetical protein